VSAARLEIKMYYLLFVVIVSEGMQCESGHLENPSAVNVTVSTGQVTV